MRETLLFAACLLQSAPFNTGCGTIVKRVAGEAIGATSKVSPVPGTIQTDFKKYQGVEIRQIKTDLESLVSAPFMNNLPKALQQFLAAQKEAPFPGGDPKLILEPDVQWYLRGGGVFGKEAYVVVLYWLSDESGPVGKVEVVTKSAASRTDDADLAGNMSKNLAKWFRDLQQGKKLKEKAEEGDE